MPSREPGDILRRLIDDAAAGGANSFFRNLQANRDSNIRIAAEAEIKDDSHALESSLYTQIRESVVASILEDENFVRDVKEKYTRVFEQISEFKGIAEAVESGSVYPDDQRAADFVRDHRQKLEEDLPLELIKQRVEIAFGHAVRDRLSELVSRVQGADSVMRDQMLRDSLHRAQESSIAVETGKFDSTQDIGSLLVENALAKIWYETVKGWIRGADNA